VGEAREGFLNPFDNTGEGHDLLDLDFRLFLVDIDNFDLALRCFGTRFEDSGKFFFLRLDRST
jgi:hypothetical protein